MGSLIRLITLALLALLMLSGTASADGDDTCRFVGTVKLDNANVPDGTIVAALIGDRVYTTVTPTGYGESTYALEIGAQSGEQYPEGTEVVFKVNGYTANQKGYLKSGENIRMDLTAWSTSPPSTTPTASLTSTPTPTPPPTPSASTNVWPKVGLAIACVVELLLVGSVVYLTATDWDR